MLVNGTTICQQTCPVGTYLDTTSTTCYVCILPCVTCTSASTCLTCVAQYPYIYQGRCLSICPTGTVASNMVCVPCLSGCKSCSSSINHCEICALNMVSNSDGSCSQPNNTCSNGYYYNVATKACGECFSTCMKCSNGGQGDCLSCFMGSFLVNGVCVSSC